mmetsp:Transcript_46282/g.131463  ORF Transcript_46282/g.131463 Transcript_46282/m.131463 type:complete len:290 (-) Transcript_46282:1240-2109(-)
MCSAAGQGAERSGKCTSPSFSPGPPASCISTRSEPQTAGRWRSETRRRGSTGWYASRSPGAHTSEPAAGRWRRRHRGFSQCPRRERRAAGECPISCPFELSPQRLQSSLSPMAPAAPAAACSSAAPRPAERRCSPRRPWPLLTPGTRRPWLPLPGGLCKWRSPRTSSRQPRRAAAPRRRRRRRPSRRRPPSLRCLPPRAPAPTAEARGHSGAMGTRLPRGGRGLGRRRPCPRSRARTKPPRSTPSRQEGPRQGGPGGRESRPTWHSLRPRTRSAPAGVAPRRSGGELGS